MFISYYLFEIRKEKIQKFAATFGSVMMLRDSRDFTLCNLLTDFKLEKSYFALRLLEVIHFDQRIVDLLTSLISRIFNTRGEICDQR